MFNGQNILPSFPENLKRVVQFLKEKQAQGEFVFSDSPEYWAEHEDLVDTLGLGLDSDSNYFAVSMAYLDPDISASIKNTLYKSLDWAYEKEWRLIDSTPRDYFDNSAAAIPYRPVAVYYGQSMSLEHKRELHLIAIEKGIKEFEMYLDFSSPKYEMLYRPYVEKVK